MKNFKAIILAAGFGSRMKSEIPKCMHEILGKSLLQYVIDAARLAGINDIAVVVGHKSEVITEKIQGVSFYMQTDQLGTGHAVMCAREFIDDDSQVVVLCGDSPLITGETLKKLMEVDSPATVITTINKNPYGYGRIVRENGNFKTIVEEKDANEEQKLITEVNTGFFCFNGRDLKFALDGLTNNNAQREYYLTDTLSVLADNGKNISVFNAPNPGEFLGINTRIQLADATKVMRDRINEYHMLNGVTFLDPDNTYIGADVTIGQDTIIGPMVEIFGKSIIGARVNIKQSTRIEDSRVGDDTSVGPFAYIRPNSNIGNNVKIGNFVEVKNSNIGNGSKASHLTYLGDCDVSENVNFGCGTVIVNYDGVKKSRSTICEGAFIGCNANIVSPVTINEGAYVAAGSTITKDVPKNSLAVARERQKNIENWRK
ncbi:MAG: bifunctional UDP-N-acetylglucosamine diphosphorylase/glucosamine-1-phosphate N-acetyltransferase GlmU [Defluviitaleaceae bacterium]|nr:bifunctional UDP-N-acetylglucosamine diphosphorylase/glucosamine-1-phosphate N-acetyltransferase GlmU [Defluviitaleaceae bacterium]